MTPDQVWRMCSGIDELDIDKVCSLYPVIQTAGGNLAWNKGCTQTGFHLFLQTETSGRRVCDCSSTEWKWRDPTEKELATDIGCQSGKAILGQVGEMQ